MIKVIVSLYFLLNFLNLKFRNNTTNFGDIKRTNIFNLEKRYRFTQIIINVKDFGAFGDGVHDDSKAIANAIKSIDSGIVWFPPGHYKITASINVKSFITLKGEGDGSLLSMAFNNYDAQPIMFQGAQANSILESFEVKNMKFSYLGTANSPAKEPYAFWFMPGKGKYTKNIKFSDCTFDGWSNAIVFGCTDFVATYHFYPSIYNCRFNKCVYSYDKKVAKNLKKNSNAVFLGSATGYSISNCSFLNYEIASSDSYNTTVAIFTYHSSRGLIHGNLINSKAEKNIATYINTGYGIWLYYDHNSVISGNIINTHHSTHKIQNSNGITISENNLNCYGQDNALELDGSSDCNIYGNKVSCDELSGIALYKDYESGFTSNNNNISSNKVSLCGGAGLLLSYCTKTVVNGNIISNNGFGTDPLVVNYRSGICLDSSYKTLIVNNVVFDDKTTRTQHYALFLNQTSANNTIGLNHFSNNLKGDIRNEGKTNDLNTYYNGIKN